MNSMPYILIAIIAFAIVVLFGFAMFLRMKKEHKPMSKLGAISLALIVAGIVFGESRLVGYGMIGAGLALALIDIIKKARSKDQPS